MLTDRVLNRTLLQRQHLLRRAAMSPLEMTEHLLGLQAQNPLPPYLSLWSRVDGFDPHELSGLLERREVVWIVLMRGTIHLVPAADCMPLRRFVQEALEKQLRGTPFGKRTAGLPYDRLAAAGRAALREEALTPKALGLTLAEHWPDQEPGDLSNTVRSLLPLLQVPPRGLWQRSGGPRYRTAEDWLGRDLPETVDPAPLVRRYLRAFGPATAADVTTWSGVTGMAEVLASLREELVEHRDERGRRLVDLAGLTLADGDTPAPVRLLGEYDNLWLSHADRARVTDPERRGRWMGANGGMGRTVFVDGYLEGLWRTAPSGAVDVELFRRLTREEREQLDVEVAAVQELLAK
jgi:hypothetical protein